MLIFSTTVDFKGDQGEMFGADFTSPFKSRVKEFAFTGQGLAPLFAKRLQSIAKLENMNGRADGDYLKLIQKHQNNLRLALQDLETTAGAFTTAR